MKGTMTTKAKTRTCSNDACARTAIAHGLCRNHYTAAKLVGTVPWPTCTAEGCDVAQHARGLCGTHYRQWKRYGGTLTHPEAQALPNELWKPVPEYEGLYEVSTLGRVKSLRRGKLLKPCLGLDGKYLMVTLTAADGRCTSYNVHRLVLTAHVGPRPDGMVACHWDDDKSNNTLTNLRWATQSDNQFDAIRNGKRRGKATNA